MEDQEEQDQDMEKNPEKYHCDEIKSTKTF